MNSEILKSISLNSWITMKDSDRLKLATEYLSALKIDMENNYSVLIDGQAVLFDISDMPVPQIEFGALSSGFGGATDNRTGKIILDAQYAQVAGNSLVENNYDQLTVAGALSHELYHAIQNYIVGNKNRYPSLLQQKYIDLMDCKNKLDIKLNLLGEMACHCSLNVHCSCLNKSNDVAEQTAIETIHFMYALSPWENEANKKSYDDFIKFSQQISSDINTFNSDYRNAIHELKFQYHIKDEQVDKYIKHIANAYLKLNREDIPSNDVEAFVMYDLKCCAIASYKIDRIHGRRFSWFRNNNIDECSVIRKLASDLSFKAEVLAKNDFTCVGHTRRYGNNIIPLYDATACSDLVEDYSTFINSPERKNCPEAYLIAILKFKDDIKISDIENYELLLNSIESNYFDNSLRTYVDIAKEWLIAQLELTQQKEKKCSSVVQTSNNSEDLFSVSYNQSLQPEDFNKHDDYFQSYHEELSEDEIGEELDNIDIT